MIKYKTNLAFTLIELLIVISILGILAVVVLVLINPAERFAQTRDTGRISSVAQLGRAINQYFIVHDETYPQPSTWSQDLTGTGDIKNFPSGVEYVINSVTPCTTNASPSGQETFCYDLDTSINNLGGVVFAKLESGRQVSRCSLIGDTYVIYSTADGKTGIICSNGEPSPWEAGSMVYLE
jgi:prepilin-type N-terminal cleavage/methylation domain-containing protein